MERVITVKGIGHVSVKPDLVIVRLELTTTSLHHKQCMKISGERNDLVKTAIIKSGLPDDSLKTSSFNIAAALIQKTELSERVREEHAE